MLFRKKRSTPRTCPEGHPQEESWKKCPFCEASKSPLAVAGGNGDPAVAPPEGRSPEPGPGATVVPKKVLEVRPLAGWVVVLNGEQQGEDFRLGTGKNVIGKGGRADVRIKDAYLSERHAILECGEKDTYTLTDLESKHGTFVNGKRVHGARPVKDGDTILLGHTEMKFRSFRV